MKLPLRISHVRLGGSEFRVVWPSRPTPRMALCDEDIWLSMYVDRQGSRVLTAAWGLAARSPRSLIYLPMRTNAPPEGLRRDWPSLDLVLLHHSMRFPSSRWKQVRARLGPGRPRTASVGDDAFPDASAINYERRNFREFRDHLGFSLAAETLFVVGSRVAFRESGTRVRGLVDDAPSDFVRYPLGGHYCVELAAGPWWRRTRGRVPDLLHIQYCRGWRL